MSAKPRKYFRPSRQRMGHSGQREGIRPEPGNARQGGYEESSEQEYEREKPKDTDILPHQLQGVYVQMKRGKTILFTKNLVPGKQVYGERLVRQRGEEYREWDTKKSKLGAGIAKNISQIGIKPGCSVLYLGCASGTTPSHVSDIVGHDGVVFALDFAPRVLREIVPICEQRRNMSPILADAHFPEQYMHHVFQVDVVFQDIAQKNQAGIFLKNCKMYLKQGGFALLSVKAKSIDIARKPKVIFDEVKKILEKEMTIVDYRNLEPFEKDHCLFVCKGKISDVKAEFENLSKQTEQRFKEKNISSKDVKVTVKWVR